MQNKAKEAVIEQCREEMRLAYVENGGITFNIDKFAQRYRGLIPRDRVRELAAEVRKTTERAAPPPLKTTKENLREDLERRATSSESKRRALAELITDDLRSIVQAIPAPDVQYYAPEYLSAYDPEEMGLMISDVHIGEKVDLHESQGLSEYSVDIFRSEMQALVRALESILPRQIERTPCPRFNIFMLGDVITGKTIFRGQQGHVDLSIGQQVFEAVDRFSELIAKLAVFNDWEIMVWGVPGNHGRIGMKGELGAGDNLDYIAYHFLKERLRNFRNVRFVLPPSYSLLAEIMGHVFLLNHGDNVRGWAGIPYYGFDRACGRYQEMYGRHNIFVDYWLAAHHHDIESTSRRIINGSWVGGTDFSVNQLQRASDPAQVLFGVHEKKGIVWQRALKLRSDATRPTVYSAATHTQSEGVA